MRKVIMYTSKNNFASTTIKFKWLVIDTLVKENILASLSKKRKLSLPIQLFPKKLENFPARNTRHMQTKNSPSWKHICEWGVYAMENNDTNTDYQKCNSLGDQKWEIVEITIGIFIFFGLRFVFTNSYTGGF